jgi:hypothetical protein
MPRLRRGPKEVVTGQHGQDYIQYGAAWPSSSDAEMDRASAL